VHQQQSICLHDQLAAHHSDFQAGVQANTAMRRIHSCAARPAAAGPAAHDTEAASACHEPQAAVLPPQARTIKKAGPRARQQPPAPAAQGPAVHKTKISLEALVRTKPAVTARSTFALDMQGTKAVPAASGPPAHPAAAKRTAFSVLQVADFTNASVEAAPLARDTPGGGLEPPVSRPSLRGERPNKLIAEAVQARLAEEAAAEATRARLAAVSAAAAAARRRTAALTPRKRPPPPPSSTAPSTAASSPVPSPPPARQSPETCAATGAAAKRVSDGTSELPDTTGAVEAAAGPEDGHGREDQAAEQADVAAETRAGEDAAAAPQSCSRVHGPAWPQPDGLRTPVRQPLRPVDVAAAAAGALLRQAIEGPKLHRQPGATPTDSPASTPSLQLPPWTPAGEELAPICSLTHPGARCMAARVFASLSCISASQSATQRASSGAHQASMPTRTDAALKDHTCLRRRRCCRHPWPGS